MQGSGNPCCDCVPVTFPCECDVLWAKPVLKSHVDGSGNNVPHTSHWFATFNQLALSPFFGPPFDPVPLFGQPRFIMTKYSSTGVDSFGRTIHTFVRTQHSVNTFEFSQGMTTIATFIDTTNLVSADVAALPKLQSFGHSPSPANSTFILSNVHVSSSAGMIQYVLPESEIQRLLSVIDGSTPPANPDPFDEPATYNVTTSIDALQNVCICPIDAGRSVAANKDFGRQIAATTRFVPIELQTKIEYKLNFSGVTGGPDCTQLNHTKTMQIFYGDAGIFAGLSPDGRITLEHLDPRPNGSGSSDFGFFSVTDNHITRLSSQTGRTTLPSSIPGNEIFATLSIGFGPESQFSLSDNGLIYQHFSEDLLDPVGNNDVRDDLDQGWFSGTENPSDFIRTDTAPVCDFSNAVFSDTLGG